MTDPGALPLRGTVTVNATATDVSGVTSVAIQYSPPAPAPIDDLHRQHRAPTAARGTPPGVADGSYDLRALATDTTGKITTSAVIASRIVNNVTSPRATDIQGTNGGTANRLETNDTIVFTYTQTILKTSISSAWTGPTLNLTVRVVNNGTSDYVDFYDSTNTNRLNLTAAASGLDTKANHVNANGVRFAATATQVGRRHHGPAGRADRHDAARA